MDKEKIISLNIDKIKWIECSKGSNYSTELIIGKINNEKCFEIVPSGYISSPFKLKFNGDYRLLTKIEEAPFELAKMLENKLNSILAEKVKVEVNFNKDEKIKFDWSRL